MCTCDPSTSAAASGTQAVSSLTPSVVPPEVPLSGRVTVEQDDAGPPPGPGSTPLPIPPLKSCHTDFRDGCYTISYRPLHSLVSYRGTLRVDRDAPDAGPDGIIVSGDLYAQSSIVHPGPQPATSDAGAPLSTAAAASTADPQADLPPGLLFPTIPIFPRSEYSSYLKVTRVSVPVLVPVTSSCGVTLVAEQYDYTQPPAGTFKGTFPAAPSRTVTMALRPLPGPFPVPFFGPRFVGEWLENGTVRGTVSLTWVSRFFRRATVEVDTLVGSVAPDRVPDGAGGTEYFETIYAKHGWDVKVIRDEVNVPVPPPPPLIDPTACWTPTDLHALMTLHRSATADLDKEWRVHLMVVPARLGCGRGIMYDQIAVPREGCASFSDDGYPHNESASFGAATDQRQRDVPRAFLRSATHEVTHTFNQIHQEQETTADNSIMTTTPSVANVLGGPTTGEPGVFPDQINLAVNTTVRHHLNHMPDPVIRPGGWPFGAWFGSAVPQAGDRFAFDASELELQVSGAQSVAFGQPLDLSWTLSNRGGAPLIVPDDVSLEGLFASVIVTDAQGRQRAFRPFVIKCDAVTLAELAPGGGVSSGTRIFWSSEGFAFPRAGQYRVTISVTWSARGVPVGASADHELFVDFPTTAADNRAAALVLNAEVGKWVALGGEAYHLPEATRRLQDLAAMGGGDDRVPPSLLAGFDGLLPDPDRRP
jgi:hypothetical protein